MTLHDAIARNIQTLETPDHDTTVHVGYHGVTIYLEGHNVRWSSENMSWLETDRMVALVEWRRRDIAAIATRAS